MATANPPISISEDNFVLELNRVRESIVTKFRELSDYIDQKKSEFLRQIDTILVSYQTYKRELETANEKKKALETTKAFHQNQLANSPFPFPNLNKYLAVLSNTLTHLLPLSAT